MVTKIRKRFDVDGYIFYAPEDEVKYCDYCGKIILEGMTDEYGELRVHENCFDKYMNNTFGKSKWKEIDECEEYKDYTTDEYDGYYVIKNRKGEWEGTGIFYTEWADEYDADWDYSDRTRSFLYKRNIFSNKDPYVKFCIGTDFNGNKLYKTIVNPTLDEIVYKVNR